MVDVKKFCNDLWESVDEHFSQADGEDEWDKEFEVALPKGLSLKEFKSAFKETCIYEENTVEYEVSPGFNPAKAAKLGYEKAVIFISLIDPANE